MTHHQSHLPGQLWLAVLTSASILGAATCLGGEEDNRQLLEILPRDRRTSLAENLDRFGRLSLAEQTSIRRLDRSIDMAELEEQSRLLASLNRYHLWFQGLAEDQQEALLAVTNIDERFRAAQKIRLAETGTPGRAGPRIAKIRTGEFGLLGPSEAAFLLKVWHKLPPERRLELARWHPSRIRDELTAQGVAVGVEFSRFPEAQERVFAGRLEQDDEFKSLFERMNRRVEAAPLRADPTKGVANASKHPDRPYAEFLYFEEKANRPRPVAALLLERFSDACPDWFHKMTDSLAADDARHYCTLVYRLIYPTGEPPEPVRQTAPAPAPVVKKAAPTKPDPRTPAF